MSSPYKGKILIVDDQENWRLALQYLLKDQYEVKAASSYEEGKKIVEEYSFDVAILDVRLVDKSIFNVEGLALARQVKDSKPDAKVVILTGYPDSIRTDILKEYNVDVVFFKSTQGSFDIPAFITLIQRMAEKGV